MASLCLKKGCVFHREMKTSSRLAFNQMALESCGVPLRKHDSEEFLGRPMHHLAGTLMAVVNIRLHSFGLLGRRDLLQELV